MSNYESMRRILEYAISYLEIVPGSAANNEDVTAVRQMLDAYAALAPDWDSAPDDAKWYTIDANGSSAYFGGTQKPEIEFGQWVIEWTEDWEFPIEVGHVELMPGIDYRECCWQRPEVK